MNNNCKNSCCLPPLSTTVYSIATYLNTQLCADELEALGAFLIALADMLSLNALAKSRCEEQLAKCKEQCQCE